MIYNTKEYTQLIILYLPQALDWEIQKNVAFKIFLLCTNWRYCLLIHCFYESLELNIMEMFTPLIWP